MIRAMLIVGGRRDSAGLIIRDMLVETGERGPCWADNKSYVDCWWEEGQCWTDNIKSSYPNLYTVLKNTKNNRI